MQQHAIETIHPSTLGRRLQEARKARGMTQREVAESMAVARTTVTALEKGERRPRPSELISMARLYGRSVGDFVGTRASATDFTVQFRTRISNELAPEVQRGLEHAIQQFQSLCEDYLFLEKLTGTALRRNYPTQYSIEHTGPEHAAEDVASAERNRLGLGDGPFLRLRETLEGDVGMRIFAVEMPPKVAGIYSYTEELGGCIAPNARHPEEGQRWTIAHEYGRFLTRRYKSEASVLSSYTRTPAAERFADAFAGSLLMPAVGLRRRFNDMSRCAEGGITVADICRVAHHYHVSVEAMIFRLEELRLLPRGTWERLRDRGFRVREAQADLGLDRRPLSENSLPLRYQLLAIRAYEEESLTEGQLARILRLDRVSARRIVNDLSNPIHLLEGGEVVSLSIELARNLSQQAS